VEAMTYARRSMELGATNLAAYVTAGEIARQNGSYPESVRFLREGLTRYPDNHVLLNNLLYTLLAVVPTPTNEIADAAQRLTPLGGEDPAYRDTLGAAQLALGRATEAEAILRPLLTDCENGTPLWFRASTHLAEAEIALDRKPEAEQRLQEILRSAVGIPDIDVFRAKRLLDQLELERLQKK